jgi:hypothetical protein
MMKGFFIDHINGVCWMIIYLICFLCDFEIL